MQIFRESLQNFLDNWELRLLVLSSLSIQCFLVLFGNKRKYCTLFGNKFCTLFRSKRKFYTGICLRITLWFAYMLADWCATISLGVLSRIEGRHKGDDFVEPKYVILALCLWAPILLLHLGGSDTMTAYAMEDNALWSRRILSYCFQVGVAIVLFLRSWTNGNLNFLAIPLFITGIIKIVERIWCLWSASSQEFKESLFPDPDAGPNFARYIEAYRTASMEGYEVDVQGLIETPLAGVGHTLATAQGNIISLPQTETYGSAINVRTADKFLNISKLLFADLILTFQDVSESRLSFLGGNGKEGFEVMEIELGFMYDLFYTKAPVIYSSMGGFLRFGALCCTVSVFCFFFVMEKNQYPKVDVLITAMLLLGAIILEIYSVISLLFSDKTLLLLLSLHQNWLTRKVIILIQGFRRKRWSCSIGQFNLVSFCFLEARRKNKILRKFPKVKHLKKKAAKWGLVRKFIGAWQSYKKFKHTDTKIVNDDLKEIIFEHFSNKIDDVVKLKLGENELAKEITTFCAHRGEKVLKNLNPKLFEKIKDQKKVDKVMKTLSCSVEVEFDQSILLWHIATNLCYNSDTGVEQLESGRKLTYKDASKYLSEYMLYLLVMRPSMLPNGIGEIRFQDTCAEAIEFVRDRHSIIHEEQVSQMLLTLSSEIEKVNPSKVKGDRSKSILFDACKLAKHLEELGNDVNWGKKEMWKLITQVWVEMLAYAACHCQVIHHAQHLRHGGELLTHVWLLMAHLGITDQLQISKGFGRAKLIRK